MAPTREEVAEAVRRLQEELNEKGPAIAEILGRDVPLKTGMKTVTTFVNTDGLGTSYATCAECPKWRGRERRGTDREERARKDASDHGQKHVAP